VAEVLVSDEDSHEEVGPIAGRRYDLGPASSRRQALATAEVDSIGAGDLGSAATCEWFGHSSALRACGGPNGATRASSFPATAAEVRSWRPFGPGSRPAARGLRRRWREHHRRGGRRQRDAEDVVVGPAGGRRHPEVGAE